jgi:octaprenyl-diphosphate synthase
MAIIARTSDLAVKHSVADPVVQQSPFLGQVEDDLLQIEQEIENKLHSSVPLIGLISRYIIQSGGKRLRPLLMVLASRLLEYQGDSHYQLSTIFEFLHAATLLHDDVVDNAELRRGNPAANTLWGNSAVVLVGDFLLATSFSFAVSSGSMKILKVLSDATMSMAEGEVLQLINSGNLEISEDEYQEVIIRKTAVLISAACQVGAILGGGDQQQEEAMHRFGLNLGLAFQLRDDFLDYAASEEEVGKPIGNDLQEGKITLPLIHALATSSSEDRQRLVDHITQEIIEETTFVEVKNIIQKHQGLEYTDGLARNYITAAKEALAIFPPSPARDSLVEIADYVVTRRI